MHYQASTIAPTAGRAELMTIDGPADPITAMTEIFERALRFSPIEADSDFFALGGDSLTAVALTVEIEATFGVSVPVTSVFDAPTPTLLAASVARFSTPSRGPLVLLRPGAGAPALFLVPAAGGWPSTFDPVAMAMDVPCPIYGFLAPGLDGTEPPLTRVEQLARRFLPALRAVQSHGPYFLGGYSMGGLTALELAQTLIEAGEEVALLVLFDTYICPRRLSWRSKLAVWHRRVLHHAANVKNMSWHAMLPFARARCRSLLGDLGIAPRPSPGMPRPDDPAITPAMRRVAAAGLAAAVAYRPRFYRGSITYFRACDSDMLPAYPDLTWQRLARKLLVREIPGNHWQMVLGQSGERARLLSECMRTALAASGSAASSVSSLQAERCGHAR